MGRRVRASVWLGGFIAVLWAIQIVNSLAGLDLERYGIVPRDPDHLLGILVHVFLHHGFGHLLSNTGPLLLLGGLTAMRGTRVLFAGSVFITLFAGLGVWAVGRSGVHVGASGLIFGYFGYLVARGFYERSFRSILVALVVGFVYWGLIFGVLPSDDFVSWEGHLLGLIGGVLLARMTRRTN